MYLLDKTWFWKLKQKHHTSSPLEIKHQPMMNDWLFCSQHSNAYRKILPELHGYVKLSKLMLVTADTSGFKSLFLDETKILV